MFFFFLLSFTGLTNQCVRMDPHNYTSQLKEVDLTETLSSAESSVSKSSISTAGSRDVKDCSKTGSGSGRPKSAVKVEHERFTDTKVLRPRRYGVQNGVRFHVKGTVQEITSLPLLFAHGRYRKLDPRDNSLQVKTDLPCFDYVHFQHITCDHALVRISDRQDLENVYVSKKMWSETEFVHINDIPHSCFLKTTYPGFQASARPLFSGHQPLALQAPGYGYFSQDASPFRCSIRRWRKGTNGRCLQQQ